MFNNFRSIFTSSFFLSIIFAAALFILIFISGISYRYTTSLTDSSALVVHSYKIRSELDQLSSHLKEAESGQRGFLLTSDSLFLRPLTGAREKINKTFNAIKLLTKNNFQQQKNLDSLYSLINNRLATLNQTLEIARIRPVDQTRLDKNFIRGENQTILIRKQIGDMIDFELMHLKVHQDLFEHEISLSPLYTLVILLFSVLVFIFAYFQINRDLKRQKKSNEELSIAHEAINHAEEIGEFSSWQWHLDTNEFKYSDNQYRLLGHQPQAFESSLHKFLEFVYPRGRESAMDSSRAAVSDKYHPLVRCPHEI